jgi:hypothetical protein
MLPRSILHVLLGDREDICEGSSWDIISFGGCEERLSTGMRDGADWAVTEPGGTVVVLEAEDFILVEVDFEDDLAGLEEVDWGCEVVWAERGRSSEIWAKSSFFGVNFFLVLPVLVIALLKSNVAAFIAAKSIERCLGEVELFLLVAGLVAGWAARVAVATTDFTCVRSFGGTFATRFLVFCCSLAVKLLVPRVGGCTVVVWVVEGVGEDLDPVSFFMPLSDDSAFSDLSLLEFGNEDDEGLGESFFGRRTMRGFILREVIVEIVGTANVWPCNTSTLGKGLDLSFPESMVLRMGSEWSKKRAWSSSLFERSSFWSCATNILSVSAIGCEAWHRSFNTDSTSLICRIIYSFQSFRWKI